MIHYLKPQELRWSFSDHDLVTEILKLRRSKKLGRFGAVAQDRALSALELGLGIKQRGYNIFVVGASGTGRTSTVERILQDKATKEPTPDDIVLLYNFDDRDRPLAVFLAPSLGLKLKKNYDTLIERVLYQIDKALDAESYLLARQVITEECRDKTDRALAEIEEEARAHSFVLSRTGSAITLTPAQDNGEAITEHEFEQLSLEEKQSLEERAERLEGKLEEAIRRVRAAEKESEDAFEELARETALLAISPLFEAIKTQWKQNKRIVAHLSAMEEDILNRISRFLPEERMEEPNAEASSKSVRKRAFDEEEESDHDEPVLIRYRVNVLVSHLKTAGAPVVHETHPTSSNLIGRIEQRIRAGETITDFTRIRAGALYRANGGYLIIEAQDLLRDPSAYEGLKRALKNRAVELDDPGEPGRMVAVASLRPEPVPLSLKVILIGTPEIYYTLSRNDPDFQKLFKVKADFDMEIDRNRENVKKYIQFLFSLCAEEELRKLTPEGAGRVLEQAVRISGSQKKITCRLGDIADLTREANFWAAKGHSKQIEAEHVRRALSAKAEREGFLEDQILEEIKSGKIIIKTSGKVIGQANALTVIEIGSYEFGLPLRVTCQTGLGRGKIIDIEKEIALGGPFHSKGRLIIRGLLSNLFGRVIPFSFHATLCMEQTYSDVDGDSASMAEACTLLSTLAKTPLEQRFGITGAIDQMGHVLAVGGINQKIEGFYRVCKQNPQNVVNGIIMSKYCADDIMLNEEIQQACIEGKFVIVTVETIQEAMELLTGIPWDKDDQSLRFRCLETLHHFNQVHATYKRTASKEISIAHISAPENVEPSFP